MGKPTTVVTRHGNLDATPQKASVTVLRHGGLDRSALGSSVRLAVYTSPADPPRITDVPVDPVETFAERATRMTAEAVRELGGRVPADALREVVANLLHAEYRDASIIVAPGGNEVTISDRGAGIADKENAFLPGYTTATSALRAHIRGVGSGLPLARHVIQAAGGSLILQDNIGGGTVVHLMLAGGPPEIKPLAEPAVLSEREQKALLLLGEEGTGGPSLLASGLEVSLSTAHRLLERLEKLGLVVATPKGKRELSAYALASFERLVRAGR